MEMGCDPTDIGKTIHPHPTLGESIGMLTIGQYLQPRAGNLPVRRYVPPAAFAALEAVGREMGFAHVFCGALVRSSYHADRQALAAGAQ